VIQKAQAFTGLISIIRIHPEILFGNKTHIHSLLVACVGWHDFPPPELKEEIRLLLHTIRSNEHNLWSRVLSSFQHYYPVEHLVMLYDLPRDM
jgi:hypothetical protein